MTTIPATLQTVTPANPDDMIGRLIDGRYQVRSLIARGGMATVYVATDLRLERRIAIKIMHDHLAADEAFRARFIREARAAAKLQHPNVVNVYDQGDDHTFAYMVMEYIPGITLRDLLHDHHRLTAEQTIDVMDAVLSGLQAAHRIGIVHRDLKPENVLLADDGRIKLSDFGLARAASANTASGQVLLGTIAYLSPELVTKGTADIRSDIYSLGIMMYEMLTGEQPYRGDQPVNIAFRHANEDVPAPSSVEPSVPGELDELVAWATERNPEDRPADAGALLAALRQAESDMLQDTTVALTARAPLALAAAGAGERAGEERDLGAGSDNPTVVVAPEPVTERLPEEEAVPALAQIDVLPPDEPQAAEPTPRHGWKIALIVLVVLLLGGAGYGGWWALAGPGSYHAVPDVVHKTQQEAEQIILDAGFTLGEAVIEHRLDVPAGEVIASDPAANTKLAPGSPVVLTVSGGPRTLPVPTEIVGLTEQQARYEIENAGFSYDPATTIQQFDAQHPKGTVVDATDATGAPLPETMAEAQPIRLIVSAGPVPDVTGMGENEAVQTLQGVGLTGVNATQAYSDTVPAGIVIRQEATSDPVRPGDTINLQISLGKEQVQVPNVVGQPVAQAVQTLQAAGLEVKHSVPPQLTGVAVVHVQTPAAGTQVDKGTTVSLVARL